MALSGLADGPPVVPRRDFAGRLDLLLRRVERLSAAWGNPLILDQHLFTERAAFLGLTRRGAVSCNGSCRLIRGTDGWLAVNLPRPDDLELVPAWLCREIDGDPWTAIAAAARTEPVARLAGRAALLGLPVAVAATSGPAARATNDRAADAAVPSCRGEERQGEGRKPLVIDLSSLWAGPLCAHLLGWAGCRVVKVESLGRPDGARFGPAGFYDLLHAGHDSVSLDFRDGNDRKTLRRLLLAADVVIEGSRPRALTQLGIDRDAVMAARPGLTWVSVTAYGRGDGRIGFGDDTAAAAGLLAADGAGDPVFLGDALADPVAGLTAAAGALESLLAGGGRTVDVSLAEAAAFVAEAPTIGPAASVRRRPGTCGWTVQADGIRTPVAPPAARTPTDRAAPMGRDTRAVLAELCP
ncbi:MAG: CoA transferase [Alphaproteobacteria bacterium]|nr:CoA transferase [Alphaproteobacteria bacterium]